MVSEIEEVYHKHERIDFVTLRRYYSGGLIILVHMVVQFVAKGAINLLERVQIK